MKRILILAVALMLSIGAFAQIESPVKWSYGAKRISPTEAVVFLKATIQDGLQRGVPSHVTADVACETIEATPEELRERMSGNLCRCGAYNGIIDAIEEIYGSTDKTSKQEAA